MSAARRAEIAARARALSGADLGPRARRLAERLNAPAAPLAFAEIAAAPDWVLWSEAARQDLARIAGVAACAPKLRRTIDGKALRIFAQTVGADRLDALLSGPAPGEIDAVATLPDSAETLAALGSAVLRADAEEPALAARLASLLPATAATIDPAAGRAAAAQARQWATLAALQETAA